MELEAFCEQHNVTYPTKLSYIKSAVKRGPLGIAETKWDETEAMRLSQQLGDVFCSLHPWSPTRDRRQVWWSCMDYALTLGCG